MYSLNFICQEAISYIVCFLLYLIRCFCLETDIFGKEAFLYLIFISR